MSSPERGIIQDDLVKQKCSLQYLHTLYLEISRARAFVFTSISDVTDIEDQHERLRFLRHEFDRLFRHPSIVPSAIAKHRFLTLCFHQDCQYRFSKALGDLLVGREISKIEHASRIKLSRPSYVASSYGWENYLMPGAPGLPLRATKTEAPSAFQALPGVGMRICSDFSREENDIIQFVHQSASSSEDNQLKNLPLGFGDEEIQLRHHTQHIILTPSPFREDLKLRLDIRGAAEAQIENLSSVIYRLEQQGPGSHAPAAALNAPNIFPIMSIRSWHRPLHRWDLHYHVGAASDCACNLSSKASLQP